MIINMKILIKIMLHLIIELGQASELRCFFAFIVTL